MSSTISNDATNTERLRSLLESAATEHERALDEFFNEVSDSAWGLAYAATESVPKAVSAVSNGIAATLANTKVGGSAPANPKKALLSDVRNAAHHHGGLEAVQTDADSENDEIDLTVENVLGNSTDRQATLAFTSLNTTDREILWLIDSERLNSETAAEIMGMEAFEVDDAAEEARVVFRKYYLDAIRREDLPPECAETLDNLTAYLDRSLSSDGTATTEQHLMNCAQCRTHISRINDVRSRLYEAIPPMPRHTRSTMEDAFQAMVAIGAGGLSSEIQDRSTRSGVISSVAAAILLALALGAGLIYANKDNPESPLRSASGNGVSTTANTSLDEVKEKEAEDGNQNKSPDQNSSSSPTANSDTYNGTGQNSGDSETASDSTTSTLKNSENQRSSADNSGPNSGPNSGFKSNAKSGAGSRSGGLKPGESEIVSKNVITSTDGAVPNNGTPIGVDKNKSTNTTSWIQDGFRYTKTVEKEVETTYYKIN